MARWKLTESHYLRVPGTKWEYSEVDRLTGRPKRTQFEVPLYLNPNDEADANYRHGPDQFEIIVSDGKNAQPKDLIFLGDPTPGMFPLDDEAREISERCAKGIWSPTAGLDPEAQNESFTQRLLSGLIDEMTELKAGAVQAQPPAGMTEFMQMMGAMMKQQTEILAKLANPVVAAEPPKPPAPGRKAA